MQVYEERMDNLKQRLAKEREKALKKGSKEVAEVKSHFSSLFLIVACILSLIQTSFLSYKQCTVWLMELKKTL